MNDKKKKNPASLKSRLIFWLMAVVVKIYAGIALGLKIRTDEQVRTWKKSGQSFVVLCAHPSEIDAVVLLAACFPRYTRFVAGAQQLYKGITGKLLRLIGVIPKKQFTPDITAIKEIMRTVKSGCVLGMMPEGRVSMDGTQNPNDISTAKLLKTLGVPVALLIPRGSYYIKPAYNYGGIIRGKLSGDLNCLFTPEELSEKSPEEILEKLEAAFRYDASEELRGSGNRYAKTKGGYMEGVSKILYRCPACGGLYTLTDQNSRLTCSACGASAELLPEMFFAPENEKLPDNLSAWNRSQLEFERSFWAAEDACLEFSVKKYMLRIGEEGDYRFCGEGLLRLDKNGFFYKDEAEEIRVPLEQIQGFSADYCFGFIAYYQGRDIRRFWFEKIQYVPRFMNSLAVLKNWK